MQETNSTAKPKRMFLVSNNFDKELTITKASQIEEHADSWEPFLVTAVLSSLAEGCTEVTLIHTEKVCYRMELLETEGEYNKNCFLFLVDARSVLKKQNIEHNLNKFINSKGILSSYFAFIGDSK